MTVVPADLSAEERELLAVLTAIGYGNPRPGERCVVCNRRVNKPRKPTSPEARTVKAGKLPVERAASVEEALDALQAFIGADKTSYPRGSVLEALVLLGGQEREALKVYFTPEKEHE